MATPETREHDLPVTWDGHPVTWKGWSTSTPTLSWHLPVEDLACQRCGVLVDVLVNSGRLDAPEPRHLYALRCPDCRHDQVLELDTYRLWDLDETDYGPAGSVDPGPPDPHLEQVEDATSDCGCPRGFGGQFRFHRHPCRRAGETDDALAHDQEAQPAGELTVAAVDGVHDGSLRDLPAPPVARSYCHGCGQLIVWATTVAGPNGAGGKLQPFDPREDLAGNVAITQPVARGRLLARALHKGETVERPLEYVGMTHFATCPVNAHPAPPIALVEHQTQHLSRRRPGGRR